MNEIITEKLKILSHSSGVYIMRDKHGEVIYVGKAKNLKNRVGQYFQKNEKSYKVKAMVEKIYDFDYFITPSEFDALALENNLIKKYQPFYNILLKDGKTFPYIRMNLKENFPKCEVVRRLKKDGAKYFGPYISGISANELVKLINYAYPIRSCSIFKIKNKKKSNKAKNTTLVIKRKYNKLKKSDYSGYLISQKNYYLQTSSNRECLNYHIGLCSAPCIKKISREEYMKIVDRVIDFLSGDEREIERILKNKMADAAENQNFEMAIEYRDKLNMISKIKNKSIANMPKNSNMDVIAYSSDGIVGAVCVMVIRGGKILGVQNYNVVDASLDESETIASFITQYYQSNIPPAEIYLSHEIENIEKLKEIYNIPSDIIIPKKGVNHKLTAMAKANAEEHLKKSIDRETRKHNETIGALERLKEILNLKNFPKRIECYDISNTNGVDKVSSMVVFINGEPKKKEYRKFIIKTVSGIDDFASMKETIERRIKRLKEKNQSFSESPDLIVIDGGRGQLSSAHEVFIQEEITDIDLISLAEKFDEVFQIGKSIPIMLKRGSVELRILQNIRDEAHRFAITFHRNIRDKKEFKSELDDINGLGKVKKAKLFKRFENIDNIRNASEKELAMTDGIYPALANKIYEYFHSNH